MIAIIDYDAGNLRSVEKALAALGAEAVITRDHDTILSADGLILPHLRMKDQEACAFLDENGRCSIHRARPAYCRMFPLGRYYQGDDFVYILQTHQCDHPRTKVKVKRWIDIPDLSAYEAFARDWHALLRQARQIAMQDEGMRKAVCMIILKRFYQHPWDISGDFYEQFAQQASQARRELGIAQS